MPHFILYSKSIDASYTAKLFLKEVCLHGLSITIVFDHDVKFVSYFLETLLNFFGPTLRFSSTFHCQIDGQTEAVKRDLDNLHRCLVGEKLGNLDFILLLLSSHTIIMSVIAHLRSCKVSPHINH